MACHAAAAVSFESEELLPPSQPIKKCEHGVYVPSFVTGSNESPYCPLCNPDANHDAPMHMAMARKRTTCRNYPEQRTMDTAEYMSLNPNERIAGFRDFAPLE